MAKKARFDLHFHGLEAFHDVQIQSELEDSKWKYLQQHFNDQDNHDSGNAKQTKNPFLGPDLSRISFEMDQTCNHQRTFETLHHWND